MYDTRIATSTTVLPSLVLPTPRTSVSYLGVHLLCRSQLPEFFLLLRPCLPTLPLPSCPSPTNPSSPVPFGDTLSRDPPPDSLTPSRYTVDSRPTGSVALVGPVSGPSHVRTGCPPSRPAHRVDPSCTHSLVHPSPFALLPDSPSSYPSPKPSILLTQKRTPVTLETFPNHS